jgi:hypothetical protein
VHDPGVVKSRWLRAPATILATKRRSVQRRFFNLLRRPHTRRRSRRRCWYLHRSRRCRRTWIHGMAPGSPEAANLFWRRGASFRASIAAKRTPTVTAIPRRIPHAITRCI